MKELMYIMGECFKNYTYMGAFVSMIRIAFPEITYSGMLLPGMSLLDNYMHALI